MRFQSFSRCVCAAPCNYWQMPFLRHWVRHHKSSGCNELEKCHPASELMKGRERERVEGGSRFLDTFFSLNALCRCQAPTASVLKRKEHEIEEGKREDNFYSKAGVSWSLPLRRHEKGWVESFGRLFGEPFQVSFLLRGRLSAVCSFYLK